MTRQPEQPKRLALSEILRLVLTRQTSEPSAVTLSRNAAGETLIEVKVKAAEDDGVAAIELAANQAAELYDQLRGQYPSTHAADDSAVKLTRNAKGETQIEVETKTDPHGETPSLELAEARTMQSYERLRRQYPLADGTATKDKP
jgi:hypothetical protein